MWLNPKFNTVKFSSPGKRKKKKKKQANAKNLVAPRILMAPEGETQ